jgi:biotin carboxyl carrier protein
MKVKYSLFRQEAIEHAKHKHLGTVFLNVPLPYQRFSMLWCFVVVVLICFFCNQKYAENWSLKGFINAQEGVRHSYALKSGVIEASYVYVGKSVKRDEVLLVINTDNEWHPAQVEKMRRSFKKRIQNMQQEKITKQKFLNRLIPLLKKKYVSQTFFDQKQAEVMNVIDQIHQLKMEEIQFNQTKKAYIKAPISGVVSSVMAHVGQHVSSDKPLLSLLPKNVTYVAELYVPVDKAGFLKKNDQLSLHYDAYPYQHFGAVKATVTSISHSILTDKDEDKPIEMNQPYYKAIASLDTPFIKMNQDPICVQQGMTFTAMATGMSRKIWQWLWTPIYLMWKE